MVKSEERKKEPKTQQICQKEICAKKSGCTKKQQLINMIY